MAFVARSLSQSSDTSEMSLGSQPESPMSGVSDGGSSQGSDSEMILGSQPDSQMSGVEEKATDQPVENIEQVAPTVVTAQVNFSIISVDPGLRRIDISSQASMHPGCSVMSDDELQATTSGISAAPSAGCFVFLPACFVDGRLSWPPNVQLGRR